MLPFAHSVIRQSETVLKIKNDRTIVEEQRYAVTILDPMGKRESRLSIYENEFQKIRQLKGKVFDAGGTLLRESQKSDVKSFSASDVAEYSDGHWEILEMDHHSYPYTVEFTSELSTMIFSGATLTSCKNWVNLLKKRAFNLLRLSVFNSNGKR